MLKVIPGLMAQLEQEQRHQLALEEEDSASSDSDSLNAGAELDAEFTPFEPHEMPDPELKSTMEEITALESQVYDLFYLHADVAGAKGMNQRFAMEAQKLLPQQFADPIGFYTRDLSVTRYQVSLEEITRGIWALIAAGVIAVIALFYKIYRWVTGSKDDKSSPSAKEAAKKMGDSAKVIQDIPRIFTKTNTLIHKGDGILSNAGMTFTDEHGKTYPCRSMQDVIDRTFLDSERYDRAKNILLLQDPLLRDIVNGGKYSQLVHAMGQRISVFGSTLELQLRVLDKVVRTDLSSHDNADRMTAISLLKTISKPIEVPVDDHPMTFADAARKLSDMRTEVKSQELSDQKISFDHLFNAMSNAYLQKDMPKVLNQMSSMIVQMSELQLHLEKLHSIARDISTDGNPGALTQDVGVEIRNVIFKAGKDVAGFGQLLYEVRHYVSGMEHLANMTVGFAKEVVRKVAHEMRKSNKEVPPAWQELIKEMNLQMRAIEKAYFSF